MIRWSSKWRYWSCIGQYWLGWSGVYSLCCESFTRDARTPFDTIVLQLVYFALITTIMLVCISSINPFEILTHFPRTSSSVSLSIPLENWDRIRWTLRMTLRIDASCVHLSVMHLRSILVVLKSTSSRSTTCGRYGLWTSDFAFASDLYYSTVSVLPRSHQREGSQQLHWTRELCPPTIGRREHQLVPCWQG